MSIPFEKYRLRRWFPVSRRGHAEGGRQLVDFFRLAPIPTSSDEIGLLAFDLMLDYGR
jgi:hypothetical protein